MANPPRIHFPEGYESIRPLLADKGWLDVEVELDGKRHPVSFRDLRHVERELKEARAAGRDSYTEPGLVVLTDANVRRAVEQLASGDFFHR